VDKSVNQRLDRLETAQAHLETENAALRSEVAHLKQAIAEVTFWAKGDWHNTHSAAGQILAECRVAERDGIDLEARVRAEVNAETEGLVQARLADGKVSA
jgi:hypothetical protein